MCFIALSRGFYVWFTTVVDDDVNWSLQYKNKLNICFSTILKIAFQ